MMTISASDGTAFVKGLASFIGEVVKTARDAEVKTVEEELGKCPKCNDELTYEGAAELDGDTVSHPVFCPACEWSGQEDYDTIFAGHRDHSPE